MKTFVIAKFSTALRSLVLAAILGSGCDLPGGVSQTNERLPQSATLAYQGSFAGSTDVSGTAQVYLSNGMVILYLAGLSTPAGTQYAVFLETGDPNSPFYFSVLKANTGNQIYSTGRSSPGVFSRVVLRATTSTVSLEVAAATLVASGPTSLNLVF